MLAALDADTSEWVLASSAYPFPPDAAVVPSGVALTEEEKEALALVAAAAKSGEGACIV